MRSSGRLDKRASACLSCPQMSPRWVRHGEGSGHLYRRDTRMSDLWIFGRRPAARVRHRHGGFNATFPMNFHTVEEQVGLFNERAAAAKEADERARVNPPPPVEDGRGAGNVLTFTPRADRGSRGAPGGDGRGGEGRGGDTRLGDGRLGDGRSGDGRSGRRPGPLGGPSSRD